MNTFLLCGGVYGRSESLELLRQIVATSRPDGILFAGGVLSLRRAYEPKITDWGMTRADSLFLEQFFESLGKTGVFSAVIPGALDTPVEEFLRIGMHAEIEFPSVHIVHATLVLERGLAITGLGGWVSEGPACELDCCSRTVAQYLLRTLPAATQSHKVLLLARAPSGPGKKHEGSVLSAELIDSLRPALCVVGNGEEGQNIRRVAHSLVVSPGFLAEGHAAWLDVRRVAEERVRLLDFNAHSDTGVAAAVYAELAPAMRSRRSPHSPGPV